MTGTDWIIAISIGLIAIAFIVLVIYLAITLVSVKQTLTVTHDICLDLEEKMHAFDPYLKVVSELGYAIEKKTVPSLKELAEDESFSCRKSGCKSSIANTAMEITEWALIGLTLWQKIKKRR